MIPYFELTVVHVGPVAIQVWGLCVAIGVLVGIWLCARAGARRAVDPAFIWDSALWIVVAGFIGARLGHIVLYDPAFYLAQPLEALRVWHGGFSSLGGFVGSAVFGVWYLRRKQVDVWKYADAAAVGLPWGWMIGRIGCFLIHDHPGSLTDFMFAVQEPGVLGEQGLGRHDLGLYDAVLALVIGVVVWFLRKRKMFDGGLMLIAIVLYAVPRFFLDFLRAEDLVLSDARYFGLTPAQYGAIVAVMLVVWLWWRKRK